MPRRAWFSNPFRPKGDVPFEAWLHWIVNDKCNFYCSYCVAGNSWKVGDYEEIDVPKVLKTLERDGRTFLVRFTGGGEPFLVSNLVELSLALSKKHYLGFNTNLISKRIGQLVERVDPQKIWNIVASLHFAELERQGLEARFIKQGRMLLDAGIATLFYGVAYPGIIAEFSAYRDRYLSQGIPVEMLPYIGTFEGKEYPLSYTADEIELFGLNNASVNSQYVPQIQSDVLLTISRHAHTPGSRIFHEQDGQKRAFLPDGTFLCNAGHNAFLAMPDGSVQVCSDVSIPKGSIYSEIRSSKELFPCKSRNCTCPFYFNQKELYKNALQDAGDPKPPIPIQGLSTWEKAIIGATSVHFRWATWPNLKFQIYSSNNKTQLISFSYRNNIPDQVGTLMLNGREIGSICFAQTWAEGSVQAEFGIPLLSGQNDISLNFSKYHQEEGGRSLAVLMEDISLINRDGRCPL